MITTDEFECCYQGLPAAAISTIADLVYDVEDGVLDEGEARAKIENLLGRFQA
jgi:hypothetical protein